MNKNIKTAVLGYPRIGQDRELKKATESYWKGEINLNELNTKAKEIRKSNWLIQKNAGIEIIPSNDFSFYDGMLEMTVLLGAIPKRFKWDGNKVSLDTYFSMARGIQEKQGFSGHIVQAMEMTKWFDTNYHYIVPEFYKNQTFKLSSDKPFVEFKEAQELGIKTRPVLIGPVTYLLLGKVKDAETLHATSLLDSLLPVYESVLKELKSLGAEWIQIDEPALVLDLNNDAKNAFKKAYELLTKTGLNIMLTTYFGALKENLKIVSSLPVQGLHVDLVRAPEQLNDVLSSVSNKTLSLGVIDGRNIWKSDLEKIINYIGNKENIIISTSCSLLHCPLDLELENNLDSELKSWLAFSRQKLDELKVIQKALTDGKGSVEKELNENQKSIKARKESKRIHKAIVQERMSKITSKDYQRKSLFNTRQKIQRNKLKLPVFPTTTIGSFPQTKEVREIRAKLKNKSITEEKYINFIKSKIKEAIEKQINIGLDVLVHGEPERNDMVEYFGEMLDGFAFTKNGWVQSYGTRYVKPPIIFGDITRPKPMTIDWIKYAQSLTNKFVKGMLTGPITILQWSFVRDDQERSKTAKQIALALRDEVCDLEKAGISIIQIDEPAIREGLPLRRSEWADYLKWAVECFKLSSCGVNDDTQIHTHMCYSEFNDIIESISAMDGDVISIEASRSQMELLNIFHKFHYPNEIGPGVYDVHSPAIPQEDEIKNLLKKASSVLPRENIWVNPDCGLKTRGWEETIPALKNMVSAAKAMRESKVAV